MEKLKELARRMNELGIPVPLARDPKTGLGSVSLTTVVVSFGVCVVGLCGKSAGFFGGVDLSQAIVLFGVSSGLYFSRKMQAGDKSVTVEAEKEE